MGQQKNSDFTEQRIALRHGLTLGKSQNNDNMSYVMRLFFVYSSKTTIKGDVFIMKTTDYFNLSIA